MCKQHLPTRRSLVGEWGRELALLLAVWPALSASATAQVIIEQDTVLESSVKERLLVRDSAAGQTELRITPQGTVSAGLEARDTAQVLVQGGTVRQSLDQFDRTRTVLEAGFIGGWNLADDAQGVMADGQAGVVKATGAAEFSLDAGKINRVEVSERAFLKVNAGTLRELTLSDRSAADVLAVDSNLLQTSGQASVWLGNGVNIANLQALERSNVALHGSKVGQLTLRGDARVEAYGSELGNVSVGDSSAILIEGSSPEPLEIGSQSPPETRSATLAGLTVADNAYARLSGTNFSGQLLVGGQASLDTQGATLAGLTVADNAYARLSGTNFSGQLLVGGQATAELRGVKLGSPDGGGALLRADGRANVRLEATFRNSAEIQLNQNSFLAGNLGVESQPTAAENLQIGLTERSIAELRTTGVPNVRMSVRDQAELDFSGPIGTLNLSAIAGGVVRLSSAVGEARINLNGPSAVHVLSGPITGSVEGRFSARQEPAEFFLHARSYTPHAQGRFTAKLLDGTKADLVADSDFQLILVDADGQQQAVDRELRFNPANGHFYKMIRTPVDDWGAAKAAAEAMSYQGAGHLVTITSQQEEQFLTDQFAEGGDFWTRGVWIGASDAAEEGVWEWVVGPEAGQEFYRGGCTFNKCSDEFLAYADWARSQSGQDSQPQNWGDEDYALWLIDRTLPAGSSGRWHDNYEGTNAGFLVEFEPLLGDADGDGEVSLADFGTVKRNFGRFGSFQQGDFNGDWTIDLNDFALLKQNFGQAAVPAPEPSAGLLAAIAVASLACLRGRRQAKRLDETYR